MLYLKVVGFYNVLILLSCSRKIYFLSLFSDCIICLWAEARCCIVFYNPSLKAGVIKAKKSLPELTGRDVTTSPSVKAHSNVL